MSTSKKIIFMGTPSYADTILHALIDASDIDIVAVYTQPDKPVGRKKVLTPPPVKETALKYNIPCFQPVSLKDEKSVEELVAIECDYIVVAAYGQILPKSILDHAPSINLHASILPQYRGASPIQQSLLNGDTQTGVTAMLMDEGLDTGAIIKIQKVTITKTMMAEELFNLLSDVAASLSVDVIRNYQQYSPVPQDESQATYCKKITKADGLLDLHDDAQVLYNKYRAYTPWPGVYLESGIKLKQIKYSDITYENKATKIVAIDKDHIVVACAQGSLLIYKVQPKSKKEMDVSAYINGKRLQIEDSFL